MADKEVDSFNGFITQLVFKDEIRFAASSIWFWSLWANVCD